MKNILEKIGMCPLKKCEICHENKATKIKIAFSGKKIRLCKKCYDLVEF